MADWFNNNLSDFIDKKEKVIIDVRKNVKFCRRSSIASALFYSLFLTFFMMVFSIVISGFISGFISNHVEFKFSVALTIGAIVFICGYPSLVSLIYNSQLSARYVLTNRGIYRISGLIFKSTQFVAYNQITDVSVHQGPIQSLFDCGSVGVGTASGNVAGSVSGGNGSIYSVDELSIDSVNDFKKIREIIIKNRKK